MKRTIIRAALMGAAYMLLEIIFNAAVTFATTGSIAFKGSTSLWMFLVGAIMGLILGAPDQLKVYREHVNMFFRCIIGMVLIYAIEYGSGVVLNGAWKLDIWKYLDPLSINGQITLAFIPVWFLICPIAFWLDDVIRWRQWIKSDDDLWIECPKSLIEYYKAAFNPMGKAE